jgi:hypothetical protein
LPYDTCELLARARRRDLAALEVDLFLRRLDVLGRGLLGSQLVEVFFGGRGAALLGGDE